MWWILGSRAIVALMFVVLWYCLFLCWHRRRAKRLLLKIETAFAGQAEISRIRWITGSQFHVHLRLANCGFTESKVTVNFVPRELPLSWIHSVVKKHRETLRFDANLTCAPGFNLEVHNQRWLGKTRRRLPKNTSVVRLKHLGPFILTSRRDWQKEITSMMQALSTSRDFDLLSVAFRRKAPHFSATIPLETIAHQSCGAVKMLEVFRELASGASAARF